MLVEIITEQETDSNTVAQEHTTFFLEDIVSLTENAKENSEDEDDPLNVREIPADLQQLGALMAASGETSERT